MTSQNKDFPYYVSFSRFEEIGPIRLSRLLRYFGSLDAAWRAESQELMKAGLDQKVAWVVVEGRKTIDIDKELQLLEKEGVSALLPGDPEYPLCLSEIYQPPSIIYYRGTWPSIGWSGMSIVGTRKITPYGRSVTPSIVRDLARSGFVIVSGLAVGVDTLVHHSALEVGGKTIAVLGAGVDHWSVYPSVNRILSERIIEQGGLIMSEYPIDTQPRKYHFPARNRIISGISLGVLVIEADERSGALITARSALEQNRDVFAVPGPITNPMSIGPHTLLKQGAKLVTGASDIIESYPHLISADTKGTDTVTFENVRERIVYERLTYEPAYIDVIAQTCQLDTATTNSTLLIMEMKGFVKNVGNMHYVKL